MKPILYRVGADRVCMWEDMKTITMSGAKFVNYYTTLIYIAHCKYIT